MGIIGNRIATTFVKMERGRAMTALQMYTVCGGLVQSGKITAVE